MLFQTIIEKAKQTLVSAQRFPLVYAFCIAGTLLAFNENRNFFEMDENIIYRLGAFLSLGALFTLNTRFAFIYNKGQSPREMAITAAGLLGLAAYAFLSDIWHVTALFLGGAMLVSFVVVPFIQNTYSNEAFWRFKKSFWLGVVLAWIANWVVIGGVSAAIATVRYLFQLDNDYKTFADICIFSSGLLFPLLVFSYVPEKLEYGKVSEKELPKFIIFLFRRVIIFLSIVYFAILYAYIAKIIFEWNLPILKAGYFVSIFAVIGLVVYLVAYPFSGWGKLVDLFKRHLFQVLILPFGLLIVAAYLQISKYGVTEFRYLLVLFCLWLAISIGYALMKRRQVKLMFFPYVLAVLLVAASFGPWGATGVSVMSQKMRLENYFAQNNMWVNGQVVKAKKEVSEADSMEISSILNYFRPYYRFKAVEDMFNPKDVKIDKDKYGCKCEHKANVEKLVGSLGLTHYSDWEIRRHTDGGATWVNLQVDRAEPDYSSNRLIKVSDVDFYASTTMYKGRNRDNKDGLSATLNLGSDSAIIVDYLKDQKQIILKPENDMVQLLGEAVIVDLHALIQSVSTKVKTFNEHEATFVMHTPDARVRMLITGISGNKKDGELDINNMTVELYISQK